MVKGKVAESIQVKEREENWPTPTRPVSWFRRWLYASYRSMEGVGHNWNRRITPKGWFVLCCLGMAVFLGLDTNRTTAYQIFAFLFALVVVSATLTPFFSGKFALRREVPRYGSVGVPLQYHIHLRNLNRIPYRELFIWEKVPDPRPGLEEFAYTPEPGENFRNAFDRVFIYYRWKWLMERKRVAEVERSGSFALAPGGEAVVPMKLVPTHRGVLQLKSARVIRLDPFALFRGDAWPECDSVNLLVLPKRYVLPQLDLGGESHYQQGGASVAGAHGHSDEFVSLREYRPGDPLRHIHWRSWARLGQPIVKEFEEQYFPRHALVLDTFVKPEQDHLFEESVSVAASFAYTINTTDSLLDLLFLGTEAFSFTAGRGAASVEKLLEILAAVQPHDPQDFGTLELQLRHRSREISAIILVLTGWDAEREAFLNNLRGMGRPVLALAIVESRPGASSLPHLQTPEERAALREERRAQRAREAADRKLVRSGQAAEVAQAVVQDTVQEPDPWADEARRTGVNFIAFPRIQECLARLRA